MAIDFNGSTSRLVNTTAALGITTTFTVCVFVFADVIVSGAVVMADEAENSFSINKVSGANEFRLFARWTGTDGQWDFPIVEGQWNHIALSYDGGATTNDPVVRVNGAAVTVTQVGVEPTLAFQAPNTGYCIGNNNAQSADFDGGIEHARIFTGILTADEMDREYEKPGSVTRTRALWLGMEDAADVNDRSGNGFNGTATALTTRDGPVILVPPGSRRLIVSHRNPDTTVGEVNATLVDKSRLRGPDGTEPSRVVIERVQWSIDGGGTVTLAWDHTTDDIAAVLTGTGDREYPNGGLVDPASAGDTGDLLLSASNVAGGSYEITLVLRMKD